MGDIGLASLCFDFGCLGVQAAYQRLADVSRFAPRRLSFVKRHKRKQKGLPRHPAPASPGFVRSIAAPRVGVHGP
ncbi:hypothetical protein ACSVIJ_22400, partial [Pseudomonas sp. NCHU5208]|uniref:hypothetical protein n=1 Tax=unclassified Pseudomonas TaxID=196821 RepID=UPI003F99E94B